MSHLSHYVWKSTVYCSNTHEFPKFVSQFSDFRGGSFSFKKKTAANQVNYEKLRNIGSNWKNNMSQLQRRGGGVNKN